VARIAFVFPAKMRKDGKRLFGSSWPSRHAKGFRDEEQKALSSGEWATLQQDSKLPTPWLSLSVEVAALKEVAEDNVDVALGVLLRGISILKESKGGAWQALRLYDLCAAIAARNERRDVLQQLVDQVSSYSPPATEGEPESKPKRIAKFNEKSKRRRRTRQATPAEEQDYMSAQWRQRAKNWSNPQSSWSSKWRDRPTEWKTNVSEVNGSITVQAHKIGDFRKR
jgi:hypothetical protein